MNDDSIAAIVGRGRTVGCVVELQAELFTPGLITRNTTRKGTWFTVGELDGAYTARAREIEALMSHVGGGRTAPIHDHLKGRASEIEFISGLVSRQGRELGLPSPCNDAVTEIDRRINRGEIRMDAANFELLKSLLE